MLVFEDMGRPDLAGYEGGKADAQFALTQLIEILGRPASPPCIRFAADYDPAGQAERTDAYYDGVASVIPRGQCGPYGAYEVIERQAARGFQTALADLRLVGRALSTPPPAPTSTQTTTRSAG